MRDLERLVREFKNGEVFAGTESVDVWDDREVLAFARTLLAEREKLQATTDEITAFEIDKLVSELAQAREAIRWALGEAPAPDGTWFGDDQVGARRPPGAFWWRTKLRLIARLTPHEKPASDA